MPISARTLILLLAAWLFPTVLLEGASVSLVWDASDGDVAGYLIHWGTTSGSYSDTLASQTTAATVENLGSGMGYYFVATAYNADGVESLPSNELYAIADQVSSTPTPTPTGTPSPAPTITPSPTPTPDQCLLNISTRVNITTGTDVEIAGFIIVGDSDKPVVVRALGPSLAEAGLKGPLSNPALAIYDSTGKQMNENDDWISLPPGTIPAGLEPKNPREAAIRTSLTPGSYTAILNSADGSTGSALIEVYDLDATRSKLRNISTRGQVGVGDNVLIGGFIIGGDVPTEIIARAIGPSLSGAGVSNALADPVLELYDQTGSLIFSNDNWRADQEQQIIDSTIPPSDDRESAIIATLAPGSYTTVMRGANNSEGVGLVEVYALSP